jgi:hypothetical protein
MNDSNAIDAALGLLLISPLTGLIVATNAPGAVKGFLAILLCLIEAVIRCYLTGELDNPKSLAAAVSTVVLTAALSYQTITKDISKAFQKTGFQLGAPKNDKPE